ncbi:hypothetical protein H7347_01720 [Corynebacterium sp. zg-331]|uniref:hypothetical protein n=1 Tax=unclassified Corynebacterium TaxID=2624378 RepID=UPI00128BB134|nr:MULTISPECIES: hypothetical protein [unclassified Corynebacterium]MBC3185304.1 hypothetical protein [Corynebacterium sp. zg-331]MPV51801.1 hypothetical protein [Corynebacterium sp. zg331]
MTRFLLSAALPTGLISAALLICSLFSMKEAPDLLAVHFSGTAPNGYATPWALWLGCTALTTTILGLFCWFSARGLAHGRMARFRAAAAAFGCFLLAGTAFLLLRLNERAPDASQVSLHASHVATLCGGALGGACLIATIARPAPRTTAAPAVPGALSIPTGGAAAWVGTASLPLLLLLILGTAAAALLLCGALWVPWLLPAGLLVFLLTLATASWQVRADAQGLTARSLLGWPRLRVAAREIEHAEVADLNPADWGGWGWRVSPRGRALMLRGGPGLRVLRTNGTVVEISCLGAEYAASVLNSYAGATPNAATRTPR